MLKSPVLLAAVAAGNLVPNRGPTTSWRGCPVLSPAACYGTFNQDYQFFVEHGPSGLVMLAQSWLFNPSLSDKDKSTLHGLWPIQCDFETQVNCERVQFTHDQFNAMKRNFPDDQLYQQMQRVRKTKGTHHIGLLCHQITKHGACLRTILPRCYGANAHPRQDEYVYYKQTMALNNRNRRTRSCRK